jgi:ribosomal protein S18 acetylase RimI-like enzyme
MHVRKEHIPQINRLLRKFFWPSIDMTDALDTPDFGLVVLYKKLVIGCAFMTPDGYITYFLIHPEWAGDGLGSRLLFLLIKGAPPHVDLTLHVSVTNPALLLYQKFGFKPEEYIVNFYDKYYRQDEQTVGQQELYSKNAFFIRLRR